MLEKNTEKRAQNIEEAMHPCVATHALLPRLQVTLESNLFNRNVTEM